jgi:UDPglucose--hexose-1-phosphate uridylyltransferase
MEKTLVWEQRWHPLREEWVLYTSHRGGRPWLGEKTSTSDEKAPVYDPTCALCPGNERLRGKRNEVYAGAYVFTNDLPCFGAESHASEEGDDLYRCRPARGTAEVICYHPDHGKTFADLTPHEALAVVRLYRERTLALGARPEVDHVLIFENKGPQVGTSNPHPHCQIYAGNLVYGFTVREVKSSRRYYERTGQYLGLAIAERESASPRIICGNDHFIACVPWFARYAYEVFILPTKAAASLADLDENRQDALARLMLEVSIRYDNLWKMPMPYVMAIHQAPTDGRDYPYFPFHIEYHPPLRKPDTLKYLAGPEIGGGSMTNESNPDEKAAELCAVPATLYRSANESALR